MVGVFIGLDNPVQSVSFAAIGAVLPATLAAYCLILFDTDFQEKKDPKGTSRTLG
jgi:hypothetical protein